MSYLVLARKWRPRTFAEVIGQDHVTHTLMKAVEKKRLAHAYLFSGPRGCGKTSTARLLAKVINCENPTANEPCNSCSSCQAVNEGKHLDMIEIDGASNRGIDEIRDLREKIGYASTGGNAKIYIIDEVHMLTQQAFNALLKTLEEPPSHVYLIFATTEPHKVPATILSRCQRFNFKRLELAELTGQLEKICRQEKFDYEQEALLLLARRAEGSMRDAESLLDQSFSATEGALSLEAVRRVLGLVDSHLVSELLEAVGKKDKAGALSVVERVVSAGLDVEEFFLAFLEGVRNLLVLSVREKELPSWLDLTTAELERLSAIGSVFRTEDLLYLFRTLARSFREFKQSSQQRYHLEAAVTEAASWESVVDLSELINKIDQMEGNRSGGTAPGGKRAEKAGTIPAGKTERPESSGKPAKMDSPPQSPGIEERSSGEPGGGEGGKEAFARIDRTAGALDRQGEEEENPALSQLGGREQWERFLSQVRESKLTLGIWLNSAEVAGIKGQVLNLIFSPQNRFAREMIGEEKNRRYIESHLERFYGKKFVIQTEELRVARSREGDWAEAAESETSGSRKINPRTEKILRDSPVARRLLEEFDGEISGGDT
ncbi:MAG: DNA polymerase III subunit gamma/tau [Candidatus Krumholzibacteriota bacterium]|nr:DNA polymerase III subunit gamma/tau [Candidatus Krumholzibacteriota bacterium]